MRTVHRRLGVHTDWVASRSSPLAGVGVLRNQERDLSLVRYLSHTSYKDTKAWEVVLACPFGTRWPLYKQGRCRLAGL